MTHAVLQWIYTFSKKWICLIYACLFCKFTFPRWNNGFQTDVIAAALSVGRSAFSECFTKGLVAGRDVRVIRLTRVTSTAQIEVAVWRGDAIIRHTEKAVHMKKKKYLQHHTSTVNLSPLPADTHRLSQPASHCRNTVTFTEASAAETS